MEFGERSQCSGDGDDQEETQSPDSLQLVDLFFFICSYSDSYEITILSSIVFGAEKTFHHGDQNKEDV